MIEIKNCPSSLQEGFDTYTPKASKALFGAAKVNPILGFDIDEFRNVGEIVDAMHRISVSGVQEKFRFTSKGQPVYITRRFDILPDGSKLPMEDFASIIGKNEQTAGLQFKYNGSYEDIAKAIRTNVAAWMVDMERFFELVVFNYIYANGDAHLKNFSLILTGQDYRLAPAYDLLNTGLHVTGDDLGLDDGLSSGIEKSDVMERTGHPCRLDFERFGIKIGLVKKRMDKILDKYISLPDAAKRLADHSFLSDKMKRNYLRIVNERISRFVRDSD